MTPYVELQRKIVNWLFHMQEYEPDKLAKLAKEYKTLSTTVTGWVEYLRSLGLNIPPRESWYSQIRFFDLIAEQIDESDGKIVIRNLLGMPRFNYGCAYGLDGWVEQRGNGQNCLRTLCCAQPGVLKEGDVLITGERVLGPPREGGNGAVLVHLSGREHGVWLSFPSRTALALLPPDQKVPVGLIED